MAEFTTDNVEVAKIAAATRLTEAILAKFASAAGGQDRYTEFTVKTYGAIYAEVNRAYREV